jgi:hypothetical protein
MLLLKGMVFVRVITISILWSGGGLSNIKTGMSPFEVQYGMQTGSQMKRGRVKCH